MRDRIIQMKQGFSDENIEYEKVEKNAVCVLWPFTVKPSVTPEVSASSD